MEFGVWVWGQITENLDTRGLNNRGSIVLIFTSFNFSEKSFALF